MFRMRRGAQKHGGLTFAGHPRRAERGRIGASGAPGRDNTATTSGHLLRFGRRLPVSTRRRITPAAAKSLGLALDRPETADGP
jgi:hypothetical protein